MARRIQKILIGTGILAALVLSAGFGYIHQIARIGTAYTAKGLCSGVFVSGRDPASVLAEDLTEEDHDIMKYMRPAVDREGKSVTVSMMGLASRTAIYRPGLGCTLVIGRTEKEIRSAADALPLPPPLPDRPWPEGDAASLGPLPAGVDGKKLTAALDGAFAEPNPGRLRRTRAVVVVYDGRIIAERYAPGVTARTPLIGWSMTKSVLNALVGILVGKGFLTVSKDHLLPEWSGPEDPRHAITLDNLLRMTSGLRFEEIYTNPLKDVVYMLFGTGDTAGFAAGKTLSATTGTTWYYSSGTSNIISRIVRDHVGEHGYPAFPRRVLFDPLGMTSAVMEPDASGTFVASSFMYATARDWARMGLLFLRDGVWNGERILPEGWVAYTIRPTLQNAAGEYGAHWWLKLHASQRAPGPVAVPLPPGSFFMSGHEGQQVTVIPSRKAVIVRLGMSKKKGSWDQETFLSNILDALPSS